MLNPTATVSPPAARSLVEICTDARLADCGQCLQVPGLPCTMRPQTGASGFHVARLSTAFRRGLISGPELVAALAVPGAFTKATVIYTDGAR